MRLLLHICCAPCSTEVFRRLASDYEVTGFFYNPNIHPSEEYESRLTELERFSKEVGINYVEGEYDPGTWFERTRGFENEPEGGKRCDLCFTLRLEETAKLAVEEGFDVFTTTLTISPHKNARIINSIGKRIGENYGVKFIEADFKKKDGFKHSLDLSRKHNLHRQSYCGCTHSKLKEKKSKPA
jgi:predicted adenine nucleotide alpha hydrolase (AANH) superfamily ATPase